MVVREGVDETKELGDGISGRRTSECKGGEAKKQNQVGTICIKKKILKDEIDRVCTRF